MTLKEKLAAVVAKLDAVLALADAEQDSVLTDEQSKEMEALMNEASSLKAQIAQREKAETVKAEAEAAIQKPAVVKFFPSVNKTESDNHFAKTGGFESLGEFAQSVFLSANRALSALPSNDSRMEQWHNFTQAAVSSRGTTGFLVPQQYADEISGYSKQLNQIVNLFQQSPTTGDSVKFTVNKKNYSASNGVQSYYGTPGSSLTESSPDFEEVMIPLHKQHVYVTVESEVLEDAPRLNTILMQDAPEAIGRLQSRKIFDGIGVNEPLGFMHANNGSLISQAKETGQTAATINSPNINKMYSRLVNKEAGAFWLASPGAKAALGDIVLGQNAAYLPIQNPLTQAYEPPLKGLPVIECDFCAALGTVNDIILVQPKGYRIFTKQGVRFDSSMHILFDADKMAFRWILRNGGGPVFRSVYTPEAGDTRSNFITLATRS